MISNCFHPWCFYQNRPVAYFAVSIRGVFLIFFFTHINIKLGVGKQVKCFTQMTFPAAGPTITLFLLHEIMAMVYHKPLISLLSLDMNVNQRRIFKQRQNLIPHSNKEWQNFTFDWWWFDNTSGWTNTCAFTYRHKLSCSLSYPLRGIQYSVYEIPAGSIVSSHY